GGGDCIQRPRVGGQGGVHVDLLLVDVEQAGRHSASAGAGAYRHDGGVCIARIVAVELVQHQLGAVVHGDLDRAALGVVDGDFLLRLDVIQLLFRGHVVRAHVVVTLGRSRMVVERHARTDDVEKGKAVV